MTSDEAVAVLLAELNARRARAGQSEVAALESDKVSRVGGFLRRVYFCRVCGGIIGTQRIDPVADRGWTKRLRTAARVHRGGHVMDEIHRAMIEGS